MPHQGVVCAASKRGEYQMKAWASVAAAKELPLTEGPRENILKVNHVQSDIAGKGGGGRSQPGLQYP